VAAPGLYLMGGVGRDLVKGKGGVKIIESFEF